MNVRWSGSKPRSTSLCLAACASWVRTMAAARIVVISAARALADISDGELSSMLFMTAPGNSNCHEY